MLRELLKRFIPHREMGWVEIGEEFTRFFLVRRPSFQVLLHRLRCPRWHTLHHDHPWSFVAVILKGGYIERVPLSGETWRGPGSILYRPAEFAHNVATRGDAVCWSIVVTGKKTREWGFVDDTA
jgi:hypothetical protein